MSCIRHETDIPAYGILIVRSLGCYATHLT